MANNLTGRLPEAQPALSRNSTSASGIATIIIMTIDVVQGMLTIRMFMEKKSVVRQNQIISTAFKVLHKKGDARESVIRSSSGSGLLSITAPVTLAPSTRTSGPTLANILNEGVKPPKPEDQEQHQVIRHALELVSTAETVLLMEYFEVTIPIVNAIFLATASQFPSAHYDPKLEEYIEDPGWLPPVLKAIGIYSSLQMLSFVAMHFVMKTRYGLSALYFLTDLSFKFDFQRQDSNSTTRS